MRGPPRYCGEARGKLQRRGPAGEIAQQRVEFALKRSDRRAPRRRRARVLRAAPPAFRERSGRRTGRNARERQARFVLLSLMTFIVLPRSCPVPTPRDWRLRLRASILAARAGSFLPGRDSTPLATSTANGCASAMACATLSGVMPPARIIAPVAARLPRDAPIRRSSRAAVEAPRESHRAKMPMPRRYLAQRRHAKSAAARRTP